MEQQFEPIPKIWRFHLIYLVVTMALSWSTYPFPTSLSMFLLAMLCAVGILLDLTKNSMASQLLAVAIGLGTPMVLFGGLVPYQTILFFACFVGWLYTLRDYLF